MTVIITTTDPAQAWAEKLWDKAHNNAVTLQATIIEIIDTKAWQPIGFDSFAEAWRARMSDIEIGAGVLAAVTYTSCWINHDGHATTVRNLDGAKAFIAEWSTQERDFTA